MRRTGWVVTGTDTAVGKTITCAALARCRIDAGASPTYVKPIQSGAADGDDDAADVAALSGVAARTGMTLGPSLAPAVALRAAGLHVALDDLVASVPDSGECIVEGAGGVLVELTDDGDTVVDLALALALPILVVVRPGLGTLNHTALTLEAIARRGAEITGIVICGAPDDPDLATRTNRAELDRIAHGRLVGVIPAQDRLDVSPARAWFRTELGGSALHEGLLGPR